MIASWRSLLQGSCSVAAMLCWISASDAWAQTPSADHAGAAPVARHAGDSRSQPSALVNRPDISPSPQNLVASRKSLLPSVHQGNWGVFNREAGSAAGFGSVGRYGEVRWAEDWSFLANAALRRQDHDPFDRLKYIPLTPSGLIYLTLSGDERLKNWFQTRPEIGTNKLTDTGRMTWRTTLGADLHIGPHLRFYSELINADAGGFNYYGYNTGYRTRLDLLQGFGELQGNLLGARSGLLLGRMEFVDAPGYVFQLRTVSSLPESWNGGRAFFIWPRFRLDFFDFLRTDITPPAIFHDDAPWNTRLYGAYASYALPDFRFAGAPGQVFLDTFYYGYLFNGAAAALSTVTGSEAGSTRRDNYGVRLWGKAGPIDFSLGAIYQGGRFTDSSSGNTRPVSAYSLNESVGWRFLRAPFRPLVGVQADIFSGGDNRRKSGTIGTYTTPYVPQSSYLDTTYYIGSSNVIDVAPFVRAIFSKTLAFRFKVPVFWRDSTNDAVYTPSTFYKFPTFSGGYVGVTPQASLGIQLTRHLRWTHDLGRFFASSSLKKAGASDSTYYLSTLSFIF